MTAVRWSVKWKLTGIMAFLMTALVTILTWTQISSQQRILEKELGKRIVLMKENLIERGKSFVIPLGRQVENDIASFDFSGAIQKIKDSVKSNADIKYAVLINASGTIMLHTLKADPLMEQLGERDISMLNSRKTSVREYSEADGSVIEITEPLQFSTNPWGVLSLICTLKYLDKEAEISRKQIEKEIRVMIFRSISTSAVFMSLCFVFLFISAAKFSKPLILLADCAGRLSRRDFAAASDIPVHSCDELGLLAAAFAEMGKDLKDSYNRLEEYNKNLEQKVLERTEELNRSLENIVKANKKIMDSIRYAQMIQSSLLPSPETVRAFLPDSFFIWMPKDIVGGDFIFTERFEDGFVLAVIDCTGHGVPGAFMTMIVCSGLKNIIRDEKQRDPAMILKRLNCFIRTTLHQDTNYSRSDDGLDAAVIRFQCSSEHEGLLTYAGAKVPLFYTDQSEVNMIKADKESVGYKRSDPDYRFSDHTLSIRKDMSFYMVTDGFTDLLNEENRRFGTRRFKELLRENSLLPFENQKEILIQSMNSFRGNKERPDDLTVVGFRFVKSRG